MHARRHQHRHRVVAGDRHQAVVLAVVGAGAAAQHADHHVIGAVRHQVEPDQVLDLKWACAQFLGQLVDVQAHLVQVGRALRDGGDGDQGDADHGAPGRGSLEGRERDLGHRSQVGLPDDDRN